MHRRPFAINEKNTQSTTLIEIQVSQLGLWSIRIICKPIEYNQCFEKIHTRLLFNDAINGCYTQWAMCGSVLDVLRVHITIALCITKKNTDENEFKIPYASSTNYPLSFLLIHTQSNWILNFFLSSHFAWNSWRRFTQQNRTFLSETLQRRHVNAERAPNDSITFTLCILCEMYSQFCFLGRLGEAIFSGSNFVYWICLILYS